MKLRAKKDIIIKNGSKVFSEGRTYDVFMDKGKFLTVYCDQKQIYDLSKNSLQDFQILH